jgi:chromosome segregation ATPase
MTNSREIAEQAFAVLRNALEESESQRRELADQLDSPRPPASDLEQAYEALQAQLHEARADRDLWKKTVSQLQDVVSNERSKNKRLSKKIGVVESGPDRAPRREISFWREKAESFEEARRKYQQRICELKEALNARDEQLLSQEDNQATTDELNRANEILAERDIRISELSASLETSQQENRNLQQRITELDAEARGYSQQVIEAEAARNEACRAADLIDAELKDLRAHSVTHQTEVESLQSEIEQQRTLNEEYQRRISDLETQHDREIEALRDAQSNETSALHEAHAAELASAHEQTARIESELEELRSKHTAELSALENGQAEFEQVLETERAKHARELEHRDTEQQAREQMHASALTKERADTAAAIRAEFEPRVAALTAQLDEQSNAFTALEAELAEERLRSDNLNELANERRESLTKTTEKLEEMEERYEDAKWQLGKASHFEKLVRRRRRLTTNLIGTIRAKQKANNSLKAGLDSLRRYKANADERQQELLRRIELLETSLSEAREKLAQASQARRLTDDQSAGQAEAAIAQKPEEQPGDSTSGTMQLRNQVSAQAEVIENLESDLKAARIAETEARQKLTDLEKLHDDLETKNTFIGTLQKDIEEHQKTLAQLRKRDIEVRELRVQLSELQRNVTTLQTENAQLRDVRGGDVESMDREKIAEQDKAISKLTAKIKEYEATINTLSEAADSWKRKYDFLAAETPYGFESASSK